MCCCLALGIRASIGVGKGMGKEMVRGMVKVWVLGKGESEGTVCSCVHVFVL